MYLAHSMRFLMKQYSVYDKKTQYIIDLQNSLVSITIVLIKEQNGADIQWIILIVQSVINQTLYQSIEHRDCLTDEITILFDVD